MNNPIAVARQYLYQRLTANTTLMELVSNRVFPSRPLQGTLYPFVYCDRPAGSLIQAFRTRSNHDQPICDVHVVGERDTNADDIDPIFNQVLTTLDNQDVVMDDGNKVHSHLEDTFDTPWDIEPDRYPRYIARFRLLLSFN